MGDNKVSANTRVTEPPVTEKPQETPCQATLLLPFDSYSFQSEGPLADSGVSCLAVILPAVLCEAPGLPAPLPAGVGAMGGMVDIGMPFYALGGRPLKAVCGPEVTD